MEAALERSQHGPSDSGRMAIHTHHPAEPLEPERIAQPRQEFGSAVVMKYAFGDRRAELGHAFSQPGRDMASVKWQVGEPRSLHSAPILVGGRARPMRF